VDVSPDDLQQDRVVDVVITSFDVALDEPDRPLPRPSDLAEGRMASPVGPEAVRVGAESLFVVWLKQRPQDFLNKFIAPGWNPQRSCTSFRLGDLRPADWGPVVSFLPQQVDDALDLLETHPIHRLLSGALCRRSGVTVNLAVGPEEQLRVEQMFVDTFQREPSGPSLLMDGQDGVGSAHHTHLHVCSSDPPGPLRRVGGFPAFGLLRSLRRHGAFAL
jgi:hypothetical protein